MATDSRPGCIWYFVSIALGVAGIAAAATPPPARKPVDGLMDKAVAAYAEKRPAEADKLLEQVLATGQRKVNANHPAAALLLFQASYVYERQKMPAYEGHALHWALTIVEKYPDAEVQKAVAGIGPIDKEAVARQFADFHFKQRHYDLAFAYYDRAYRYVAEVALPDKERNLRLARNSAGRMATACSLQNWPVAEKAMKELKERAARAEKDDPETRQQFDNWIRYGEPRIAARKC